MLKNSQPYCLFNMTEFLSLFENLFTFNISHSEFLSIVYAKPSDIMILQVDVSDCFLISIHFIFSVEYQVWVCERDVQISSKVLKLWIRNMASLDSHEKFVQNKIKQNFQLYQWTYLSCTWEWRIKYVVYSSVSHVQCLGSYLQT